MCDTGARGCAFLPGQGEIRDAFWALHLDAVAAAAAAPPVLCINGWLSLECVESASCAAVGCAPRCVRGRDRVGEWGLFGLCVFACVTGGCCRVRARACPCARAARRVLLMGRAAVRGCWGWLLVLAVGAVRALLAPRRGVRPAGAVAPLSTPRLRRSGDEYYRCMKYEISRSSNVK